MVADFIYANNGNWKFYNRNGISTSFLPKGKIAKNESFKKILRKDLSRERATRVKDRFGTWV